MADIDRTPEHRRQYSAVLALCAAACGSAIGPVLEMQVIVGQSYPHTRTPMFVSAITQVIFQPYWDVPAGILKRELLPRIRKDPRSSSVTTWRSFRVRVTMRVS